MKRFFFTIYLIFSAFTAGFSQYYYGVKGGLGLNMQQWNSFERDILFTPLLDLYTETHDDPVNKLYASIGYHTRGSAVRGFGFNAFNAYKFNNVVLETGFKQVLSVDKKYNGYYFLGGRLEYTVNTNLGGRTQFSVYNLVDDAFVNKLNYGLTVGGGLQYDLSRTRVVFVELSINPDASKQYEQSQIAVVTNPNPSTFNPNPTVTIQPQMVRNVSLELKLGIKFLQGYYEEEDEDY